MAIKSKPAAKAAASAASKAASKAAPKAAPKPTQPDPANDPRGPVARRLSELLQSGQYDLSPKKSAPDPLADYKNQRTFDQQLGQTDRLDQERVAATAADRASNIRREETAQAAAYRAAESAQNFRQAAALKTAGGSGTTRSTSTSSVSRSGDFISSMGGNAGLMGGAGGAAPSDPRLTMQGNDIAFRDRDRVERLGSGERMQGVDIAFKDRDRDARLGSAERMQGVDVASRERMQGNDIASRERMPGIQANAEDDLRKKAALRALNTFNALKPQTNRDVNVNVG